MKINIEVEAKECPYWNYETHERGRTCGSCDCVWEGNNIHNVHYGVMIGLDRYCLLNAKIYPEILKSLEDGIYVDS